jgi:effector protein SidC
MKVKKYDLIQLITILYDGEDKKVREKQSYDHIYIDSENQVHIMIPIMSGDTIGMDNTCQIAQPLHTFNHNIKNIISDYIKDLEIDLAFLKGLAKEKKPFVGVNIPLLIEQKNVRHQQLACYMVVITALLEDQAYKKAMQGTYTETGDEIFTRPLPAGIQRNIKKSGQNFVGILCTPRIQDNVTLLGKHLFSVRRIPQINGRPILTAEETAEYFSIRLREEIALLEQPLISESSKKMMVIKTALGPLYDDMNQHKITKNVVSGILASLDKEIKKIMPNADVYHSQDGAVINKSLLVDILGSRCAKLREIAEYSLNLAFRMDYWDEKESHFTIISRLPAVREQHIIEKKDQFSIAVQLFFAYINLYCYEHDLMDPDDCNMGMIIEYSLELTTSDTRIKDEIISIINHALHEKRSVEEAIFHFVNSNYRIFCLRTPLSTEHLIEIRANFDRDYSMIKDSPHFDEFGVLLHHKKKGDFRQHQGHIVLPLFCFLEKQNSFLKKKPVLHEFYKEKRLPSQISNQAIVLEHKNSIGDSGALEHRYIQHILSRAIENYYKDCGFFRRHHLFGVPRETKTIQALKALAVKLTHYSIEEILHAIDMILRDRDERHKKRSAFFLCSHSELGTRSASFFRHPTLFKVNSKRMSATDKVIQALQFTLSS